jgi:ECF transporter S component (folate family)
MLMALSVVIGILCKNFFTWGVYYRVTFENFPVILAGFCFGPLYGAVAAAGADVISCLCSTNPMVNPVITLGAAAVGFISGIVPYLFRRCGSAAGPRTVLAVTVALAHLIGQVLIKSVGKIWMFGMPWWGIFVGLGISVFVGCAEFFFIRSLLKNREIAESLRALAGREIV